MPRRKSVNNDSQGSEGISEELSSFLSAFAAAQAESNRQLVASLLAAPAVNANFSSSPAPSCSSHSQGNFAACTARFGKNLDPEALEAFIDSISIYKECTNISDEHALKGLSMLLEGDAAIWFRGVKKNISTWDEALTRLRSMYGRPRPPHKVFREIFAAEQGEERAEVFIGRIRALFAIIPYPMGDRLETDIVYGLLDRRIRKRITRESVKDLDELMEKAKDVEESLAEVSSSTTQLNNAAAANTSRIHARTAPAQSRLVAVPPPPPSAASSPAAPPRSAPLPPAAAPPPQRPALPDAAPPQPAGYVTSDSSDTVSAKTGKLFCIYCRKSGHVRNDCAKLKVKSESTACYGCGKKGVIRSNCDNCSGKDSRDVFYSCDFLSAELHHRDSKVLPQNNVLAKVNDPCTLVSPVQMHTANIVYDKLSKSSDLTTDLLHVNTLNVHNSVNPLSVNVSENNKLCHTKSMCADLGGRPILHIEIHGQRGTGLIDTAAKRSVAGSSLCALLQKNKHSFRSDLMKVKLADGSMRNRNVKLADVNVTLEGLVIPITFIILPDATSNDTLLGIDFLRKARIVINIDRNVWSTANRPEVTYPLRCEASRNFVGCAATDLLRADEGTMLSPSQRTSLSDLLQEYEDVFGVGGRPTPFAEHCIDTGDHPPIAVPPYRLTPAKKAIMEDQLQKMLKDDIIEECESAWAAPALLVPKKDGTFRFCVDYRKLNAVTKSDAYPLPVIDDLLQYTGKSCYMTTIDLQSGYWQVAVREADKDKTAFVTPFGVHRFKRMPFGLRNAPATFQRLIDRFKSGATLKDVTILGYIDDLIILSGEWVQHLRDLRAVFDRLRVFNLRANRAKCMFARDNVKYLGHVITPEGVSPDPDKVAAITEMKEPTTLKHLKSFLQTCSWFRKFVPDFSKIAQPLTLLTKKNQSWKWEEAQVDAFKKLKELLTSAPILTQPDYNLPFVLRTDASNYALGAVLLQGESPREERPIVYASRLLTPAERNYSTTEREALAVVWAVEKFRGYIDGHEVRVSSDHQPLKWLLTLKSPAGRLVRWAMKLQSFNLIVDYTPGKANVIADTLSRPPCDEEARDACGLCTVVVETPRWDATSVREDQLADPEVAKIIHELEGREEVAIKRWTERGYHMCRGVLYRYADTDAEEPQLVVPENLRKKVMIECHDAATSGHGGVERTLHRISQRFYFPGMRRYVEDYLKTCVECQKYKPSNQKPPGLIQTPVPAQRFEVLAVDLFGPLPKGARGERWILIVEDTASKWVELFALNEATAEACAKLLIEEVFLRFGVPRRLVSDNGVQFVADVMQHAMFVLGVKQNLVPLYHPEANPVERKNRDLKTQIAILVQNEHNMWPEVLPFIRFSLNTALTSSTGQTPAYLTFARELRSPLSVQSDLRSIIEAENYVPQVTPYLLKLADTLNEAKERIEHQQDLSKAVKDKTRNEAELYEPGDLVLLRTHTLSNAHKGVSSKFVPKRDGPYRIERKVSPTTYILTHCEPPNEVIGKYHTTDFCRYHSRPGDDQAVPVAPKRKRGRPRKLL